MLRLSGGFGLVVGSAVMLLASAGSAFACRCTEPTPRQAYRGADSVVYGQILSARKENDRGDVSYIIAVAEAWKRKFEGQITIHSGTTCSFVAEAGQSYVLFLKKDKSGAYYTAQCMGDRPETDSGPLLDFLRSVAPAQ